MVAAAVPSRGGRHGKSSLGFVQLAGGRECQELLLERLDARLDGLVALGLAGVAADAFLG